MRYIGVPELLVLVGIGFNVVIALAIWQVFQTRRDVKLLRAAVEEIRTRLGGGQV